MDKNYEAITCKAAMYSQDGSSILVVEYPEGGCGLPGGHLEKGEEPIDACIREVREELGVEVSSKDLVLKDSWRHTDGRIILGYVSSLPLAAPLDQIDTTEIAKAHWVHKAEIMDNTVDVGTYRDFILNNW